MDTYRDYNEEKLLIMITHYPCLYDSRDANYKSLEYRENAWIQIAKEMQVLGTTLALVLIGCVYDVNDFLIEFKMLKWSRRNGNSLKKDFDVYVKS